MQIKNRQFSKSLLIILTAVCAVAVANLYYDQVLLFNIAKYFSVSIATSGLLVTAIQIGYTIGLFLLVPLGDMFSRRILILSGLVFSAIFIFLITIVSSFYPAVVIGFFLGLSTFFAQVIIPFVSSHTPAETRSARVGHLLTGIFLGVLFGRVFGGFIGQFLGWKAVHEIAAVILLIAAIYLYFTLPDDQTEKAKSYKKIMGSLLPLLKQEKVLRETILFGTSAFCVFNIFWVSLSFILENAPYYYGSVVVGAFGFIGIAGTLAAGFSGKLADSKKVDLWNILALSIMLISFLVLGAGWTQIIVLILVTFILDVGSRMNTTINQGRNYKLNPQNHSRYSSLYMVFYYLGGSLGSLIGANVYHAFGVIGIVLVSCAIFCVVYVYFLISRIHARKSASMFS
ncbi:MFS transporter [Clostridium ljungdahlii]|uniref:Inner membrane transport protein YnfM n=1 Tax=Clostridium ljungdahlii TaxID=1538 RepID=A0A168MKS5_9CLOT|nr:MFS transporter [Clostridium ljungdahlii]OAA84829.1 Inner membrane transport protein YnfM [Clostridium ljungdahlii]